MYESMNWILLNEEQFLLGGIELQKNFASMRLKNICSFSTMSR